MGEYPDLKIYPKDISKLEQTELLEFLNGQIGTRWRKHGESDGQVMLSYREVKKITVVYS